jgi:hypothetical protein
MFRRPIVLGACAVALISAAACGSDAQEGEFAPSATEQPMSEPTIAPAAETPTTGPGMAPSSPGQTSTRGVPGALTDSTALQGNGDNTPSAAPSTGSGY